jgi:hypothetical protein
MATGLIIDSVLLRVKQDAAPTYGSVDDFGADALSARLPFIVVKALSALESMVRDMDPAEKAEIVQEVVVRYVGDLKSYSADDRSHIQYVLEKVLPNLITLLMEIGEGKHQKSVGCLARVLSCCWKMYNCCCLCKWV